MTLVEVNGIRLSISDSGPPPGKPDAPVLVMGHGLLFSTSMWRFQVEALRDRYRCVAIDWRGQGATPPTDSGYDMDTLYEDAVALIEHLDVGPVHYLGLSMGGFVGMRLAARRPDLVRSLTLIDTSAGPEDPEKVKKYRLLATIYGLLGMRPLLGQVAPIMFTRDFLGTDAGKAVVSTWTAELARQDRAGTKKAIRGVTDRVPVGEEIRAITAPTLVVVGSGDVATPVAKAEAIAAAIPGSRLDVLAGVGHVSTLEDPARINACIEAFLDGLPA
jgi:pimeloyl-ACP methyl ester carboxylesterase